MREIDFALIILLLVVIATTMTFYKKKKEAITDKDVKEEKYLEKRAKKAEENEKIIKPKK
jgi:hypothetical protein